MRRKLGSVALLPFSVASTLNTFFRAGKLQSELPVGGTRSTPGAEPGLNTAANCRCREPGLARGSLKPRRLPSVL